MIVGIVPAAGKSERMGRPKLLLPLGPRRVIEHVLDALARSHVDRTIVVIPPAADDLAAAARAIDGVEVVQLGEPTPDMRSSILHGLAVAERLFHPTTPEAFLVVPADQPALSHRVINSLIARFGSTRKSVHVPTYDGRRGHPVLFAWSLVERARTIPPDRGFNSLVDQLGDAVAECPIDEPGLLVDVDTPEDYERLLNQHALDNRAPPASTAASPRRRGQDVSESLV